MIASLMAAGYIQRIAVPTPQVSDSPRHPALVRVTHWISALSFFGLVVSGAAILVAHPRFYWGETGGLGTPSVLDLPLPFLLGGPSGWGRNLHFLSAWVCVLTGMVYVVSGLVTRHFRRSLVPDKTDLAWSSLSRSISSHLHFERPSAEESMTYNVLQRLSYLAVVFVALPLMIWTGLAMSPAIVSVFPAIVTVLGGQQTARTLHFFASVALVLFLLVHIVMIFVAGFWNRVRTMITGRT